MARTIYLSENKAITPGTQECNTCHLILPLQDFFSCKSKTSKKRYYNHRCRVCSYEIYKPVMRSWYKKNPKNRIAYKQSWIAANLKNGRCYRCSNKVPAGAIHCLPCYIQKWIRDAVRSIRNNKCKTIPIETLQHRSEILTNNKHLLAMIPGAQGYPNNKLGHTVSVAKDPQGALLATNIRWMKHKPRGRYKNKCLELQ